MIPSLPFCHRCSKFLEDVIKKGPHSLTVYSCEAPEKFATYLNRAYPQLSVSYLTKRLSRLPLVLYKNLSKESAMALMSELALYPCEFALHKHLPGELRLPPAFVVMAVAAIFPIIGSTYLLPGMFSAGERLAFVGMIEVGLAIVFRAKIQPLISAKVISGNSQLYTDACILDIAAQFGKIKSENTRDVLGNVIAKYARIMNRLKDRLVGVDAANLEKLTRNALVLATNIEKLQTYLSTTTLNAIKEKASSLEIKIKSETNTRDLETLINAKAQLDQEFENYQKLQDEYSSQYLSLVNLNGLFKKLEDELEEKKEIKQTLEELTHTYKTVIKEKNEPGPAPMEDQRRIA